MTSTPWTADSAAGSRTSMPLIELYLLECSATVVLKGSGGSYCGVERFLPDLGADALGAAIRGLLAMEVDELDVFSSELDRYWNDVIRPLEMRGMPLITLSPASPSGWTLTGWGRTRAGELRTFHRPIAGIEDDERLRNDVIGLIDDCRLGR